MLQRMLRASLIVLSTVGILAPAFLSMPAFAQKAGSDPLFIDVQPTSPAPGAQTTITIDSSTYDLSQATIRWTLNGSPVAAGAGVRTLTFTMGPSGKSTIIGIVVVPTSGTPFTRTLTFSPGNVVLLWEADTYLPPFFPGKSLYAAGADIRVLAIPDVRDSGGNLVPSGELNFKWQMNGDAYADHSGLGRDVLSFPGHWNGGTEEIVVDVLRRDGSKAAHGALFIKDEDPRILFYKKDPLRGVQYEHAFGSKERLSETETTIVAEPYYMSGASRKNFSFQYEWTLNGSSIDPQGADPAVLTLRQNAGQVGSADLTFSITNTNTTKLLQNATAVVTLLWGSQNANFFGL